MADGKVTISTELDNRGFKRGVGEISGSLGGLKGVVGKLGAAIGAAFAVGKLVQFGAACAELGSNVAEVQNVVDTAFGDMAWKMEAFADTAITSYGMSELAAKKTGSTYMAMARGLGMAEDAASDMAIALTGLTGDVASFFNISQEEADTKLKSIFTGETETLKELGVVMTQANLEQYALAHGMNANIQAMTQAEQVALRYAFVTDSLRLAAGDFVKTQGSWANQTRILSMQWQQFMAVIGQALTTVLLPVVQTLNSIVSGLISMANAFNAAIQAIFGGQSTQLQQASGAAGSLAAANGAVGSSAQDAAQGEQALADGAKAAGKAAKGALASFDKLNVLQQDTGSASAGSSAGAAGAMTFAPAADSGAGQVPPALELIKEAMAELDRLFGPSLAAWGSAWDTLRDKAVTVWPQIEAAALGLWKNGLVPLAAYLSQVWAPDIVNAWSQAFAPIAGDVLAGAMQIFADRFALYCGLATDAIHTVILPALALLRTVWTDMMDAVSATWARYGQPLVDGAVRLFQGVGTALGNLWTAVIQPVLTWLIQRLQQLWQTSLYPLWQNLLGLFADVGTYLLTGWNEVLLPLINWITTTFGPAFSAVLTAIGGRFSAWVGVISDAVNIVLSFLRGLLQFLTAVFQGDWDAAWQAIGSTVGAVWDGIERLVKNAVNGVIGVINSMISAVVSGLNAVIGMINSLSFTVPEWVPGLGGASFGLNIPSISPPQIPYLAQGAVLPPNRPFLAMVGDQSRGTNIEAPLETIKQALAEVLGEDAGREIVIKFAASGGLAELVRLLKPYIDKENNRVGTKLVTGGAY